MLLIVFIFIVKILSLSCVFENKNQENSFNKINRQRINYGFKDFKIHIILQLAAEKRCDNQQQLIESYKQIMSNTYRDEDWPKRERLDKSFSHVHERIYLYGVDTDNDFFHTIQSSIFNMYRKDIDYIGIAFRPYKNFSAQCILYGSSNDSTSNQRRLIRLLYILIGCGILLLSLIVCTIINDQQQMKLKQQLEQATTDERSMMIIPKKSSVLFTDNGPRLSSLRRTDFNRKTMTRFDSLSNERPSAIHSFEPET